MKNVVFKHAGRENRKEGWGKKARGRRENCISDAITGKHGCAVRDA